MHGRAGSGASDQAQRPERPLKQEPILPGRSTLLLSSLMIFFIHSPREFYLWILTWIEGNYWIAGAG